MGLSRYLKIFRLLPVKVLRFALLIVVHSFMGTVLAQSPPPSIQGVLLDADTLQVISQGTVSIISNDLEPTSAEPDVNGVFRFRGIPEGVYQLLVESPGYQPSASSEIRVLPGRTAIVNFDLNLTTLTETVVVTPGFNTGTTSQPVTITTYDREEIRRAPGSAGDVLRAVDSLPGVSTTGEFASFSVRGRGPRDNLILVDGIPFDKVVHFDQSIGEQEDLDGGGRFSIFAPNLIQNITFQPGGFAAGFGGKNGSLLELEVAEGNPVTPSFSGRLDLAGWEFNYDGPSYVSKKTSILFSARAQDFGRLFDLIGQRSIGTPSLEDVILKTSTSINSSHRINLLGIFAPERYVRTIDNVVESDNFENTFLARTAQDSGLFGLNWRWLTGPSSVWTNTFFYRGSDKRSIQGDSYPDLIDNPVEERTSIPMRPEILNSYEGEREVGWRSDFRVVTANANRISAGARITDVRLDYDFRLDADWTRFVFDNNDFRSDPETKYIVLRPQFLNSSYRGNEIRTALYADYALTVSDRLTITPGTRWEHDGFSGESLWSPRFNATFELNSATRLTAATGIFYQHPRFLQLAANPANTRLKNERSTQISFGISRLLTNNVRASVEAYYQSLDRLVIRRSRTTGQANNSGTGHTAGLDFLLGRRLLGKWYGQITYSFQRSKRDDNFGAGVYNSDYHRPHVFNTLFSYDFTDRLSLAGKWRFASGRPTDAFIVHANVLNDDSQLRFSKEITGINIGRLPNFHTLNLRMDYLFRINGLNVITFLDIINVYARENVDSLVFQERTGQNILRGLGAFPQFGVKLEF